MIYPKPIYYYQCRAFEGERAALAFPSEDTSKLTVLGADEHFIRRVIGQLEVVRFRRFGRLIGDYAITTNGRLALDRSGAPIKINIDGDDDIAHFSSFSEVEKQCISDEFISARQALIESWDNLPVHNDIPVLSEPYASNNYYHFVAKFLPKLRRFVNKDTTVIGVPATLLERPFQRELISLARGDRRIIPLPPIVRVANPTLLYEPFSPDMASWLQDCVGVRAKKGGRRIYISRGPSMVGRKGGNVVEDHRFTQFLEKHRFETIWFGSGDVSVVDQIKMLDGAGVILAAHGANLTNIVFAEPGISVIELLPSFWAYPSKMQLALAASLNYVGVVCGAFDEKMNLEVDLGVLDQALARALELARI